MQTRRSVGSACVGIIVALILLAAPAHGQGTNGAVSNPISTRELNDYAKRLALSSSQRTAFESLHDEYKRDFRGLRDGDIATFLAETNKLSGSMPEREEVERLFNNMSRIEVKVGTLDARLFDRLLPLLTEEQQAMLPRVRLSRERARYNAQQMMWPMGSRPADLSEIFNELEVERESFEAADPLVALYEQRLTQHLRKLSKATSRMYLDLFDRLEEMGLGDLDQESLMSDPEIMQKFMEAMRTIWQEISEKTNEIAKDVSKLNKTSQRSIASALPDGARDEFLDKYYIREYPRTEAMLTTEARNTLEAAAKVEDLPPDLLAAIQAMYDEYRMKSKRMLEEAVELIDHRRENFSPFDFNQETFVESEKRLAELQRDANALQTDTNDLIKGRLGEWYPKVSTQRDGGLAAAIAAAEEAANAEETAEVETGWSGDAYLPSRVTRAEVRRIVDKLALDEGAEAVLDQLYQDYVAQYQELGPIKKVQEQASSLWQSDEDGTYRGPTEDDIERVYASRQSALRAIEGLDASFFEQVDAALTDDDASKAALARIQRGHRRASLLQIMKMNAQSFGLGRSNEGSVDVVAILEREDMTDEQRAAAYDVADAYEVEHLEALYTGFAAQLTVQKSQEKWSARTWEARQENQWTPEMSQQWRDSMEAPSKAATAARQRLAEMNRELIDELGGAIGTEHAESVRRAYRREAFPGVFDDPTSVQTHLTRALELDDITTEQRTELAEIASAYRPEYERLSMSMADISASATRLHNPMSMEPADWQAYQDREMKIQRLQFDRSELNERTINRIRHLLADDQIRRVGGLPEPVEEKRFGF